MMSDVDVLTVNVRDSPEVQASSKIKGAMAVSRGRLGLALIDNWPSNPADRMVGHLPGNCLLCGNQNV